MPDHNNQQKEIDEFSGTETTGHEWDGIRELDNPPPRWWMLTLYACIIWAIGYWILMPAWPLISSHTTGVLGYTERGRVVEDIKQAKAAQSKYLVKLEKASLEQIRTDPELREFAMAGGRSAYNVNCSQCHGSGASGSPGFPNLNDDDWIWGGTLKNISYTITHGARNNSDDDARTSDMPKFLTDEVLKPAQIDDVAEYVLSLSGKSSDKDSATRGKAVFKENCVDCHGAKGQGNQELGAPKLNDAIWLFGGTKDAIVETISYSRGGVMPAWGQILDKNIVKQLTVYVHSLGGGK
ncbi:MAG: cytochrome-c oxidase, cbb3-type subunit III [Rhodospirillaceae bacterium]|jgi:cytochrome c oxidase cbb3-type subunit 3|nr:cytochrome-c oxidase, cbb3-type subunit III [Rhodospirillales bacterium]MBT3905944.1 cytochrome-c oxidase, cbb3-type subunit III [Rhodospirillaceae bacterium]MBT4700849.1 cytochrome-c oxidase, cbb3-type subunit III [Rhodospirillaceae bacterium]MBT5034545.1 cytochrome-c oxidase, cbb3-type subunit III [Rhodospirillaceae bacterium]MBT6221224.1 cytochrome-c oxidase, cbb3-type subunit III [Rhodospirillaceae bacterium]